MSGSGGRWKKNLSGYKQNEEEEEKYSRKHKMLCEHERAHEWMSRKEPAVREIIKICR